MTNQAENASKEKYISVTRLQLSKPWCFNRWRSLNSTRRLLVSLSATSFTPPVTTDDVSILLTHSDFSSVPHIEILIRSFYSNIFVLIVLKIDRLITVKHFIYGQVSGNVRHLYILIFYSVMIQNSKIFVVFIRP